MVRPERTQLHPAGLEIEQVLFESGLGKDVLHEVCSIQAGRESQLR